MLEKKLEILLITYNRADYLKRTLAQLLESTFSRCQITILDNCSTDETEIVCGEFQALFQNMKVVRHKKNIGACPNYLRAVELSNSLYTWILCDDDLFDFTDCADVVAAVEAESYDLISLCDASSVNGFPEQVDWKRGSATTSRDFIKDFRRFWMCAFVPSLIFRTELFDSVCLAKGYLNAVNLYPHFEFLKRLAQKDFSIYSSKKKIVYRDPHDNAPSGLYWAASWANSCSTIEDRKLRRLVMYQSGENRSRWFKGLVFAIIAEKLYYPEEVSREFASILMACSLDQLLMVSLLTPLVLTPAPIYKFGRKTKRYLLGSPKPDSDMPFDYFRI
jgi:glycosyltransferase involved in cell wall biosynthesis